MCVILVARKDIRPSEEMIQLSWDANPQGAGAAWKDPEGLVNWRKGMTLEEVQELNKKLPFPYVLHFRVASAGMLKIPGLNHPFPVEKDASISTVGRFVGDVVFHNGHWASWKHEMKDLAAKGGWKIPEDPWSDSRAMAWVASQIGVGFLELLDEKIVRFGPDGVHIMGHMGHGGWDEVDGILVSNRGWEKRVTHSNYTTPPASMCGVERAGGTSRNTTFQRSTGELAQTEGSEGNQQKAVQATNQAATGGDQNGQETVDTYENEELQKWLRDHPHNAHRRHVALNEEKCQVCFTKAANVFDGPNQRFGRCWSCYDRQKKAPIIEAAIVVPASVAIAAKYHRCEQCKINSAATQLTDGSKKWICGTCWRQLGKPDVEYNGMKITEGNNNTELERRRADAARGISRVVG